jgi:hypothetical protein
MEQKPAAAPPPPAAPAPHAVTFHSKDFAFSGPDTIAAGATTFTLVNDGPGIHHIQLVRLDSGKTVDDFKRAMKGDAPPAWAFAAGGPNAPMPGQQAVATVDLAAGNYVMMCVVDVPDRVPHFMKGMIRGLVVMPAAGPAPAMPTADYSVTATEFTFQISDTVRAGKRTFNLKLLGQQAHEAVLFKLDSGKTLDDLGKWAQTYKGPPPGIILGGVTAGDPGLSAQFTVDITPGSYALLCFVVDPKDHKPHIAKGMALPFKVG